MNNNHTIKYKLLKDLPNVNAGAEIKMSRRGIMYTCEDKNGQSASFAIKLIENNPEWFEKITVHDELTDLVNRFLNEATKILTNS